MRVVVETLKTHIPIVIKFLNKTYKKTRNNNVYFQYLVYFFFFYLFITNFIRNISNSPNLSIN